MNLGKHVKGPLEEWLFADSSQVPVCARSAHIIGHYIKDRRLRYPESRSNVIGPVPFLVRLGGLPKDDATRERIERQIRQANRQWRRANAPLRARLV